MSELPSRDKAQAFLSGKMNTHDASDIVTDTFRMIAEGRLFDREAIDYEAAANLLAARFKLTFSDDEWVDLAYDIAAALGVSDE